MTNIYRQGAVGALLDEYERAISELKLTVNDISEQELIKVVDNKTTDSNCKSVQTILSHVVRAGYGYAINIRKLEGNKIDYPDFLLYLNIIDYQKALDDVIAFTADTLKKIRDNQLEQFDNSKKIMTSWGQSYDIEQIIEHAIVHILRHRRQIEKFKITLRR